MKNIIKTLFFLCLSVAVANASDDIEKCKQAISYFENFDTIWDEKDKYDEQDFLPLRSACKIAVEKNPKNTEYRIALATLQLNIGEAEEGIKNLETAIQQGSDKAKVQLSTLILLDAGQQQDWDTFKLHLDILQDLAKAGNIDALKSSIIWWQINEKGFLKYSTEELKSLIEKEARKGDRQLQQLLGLMSETDKTEIYWYVKSAEQGNKMAGGAIVSYLSFGYDRFSEEVKSELNKIITSAESGNPYAQNILADAYALQKPKTKSLMWRKKAAENGNMNSQFWLGWQYLVDDNPDKAKYWLNKAIKQGSKQAKTLLQRIKKRTK